MENTFDWRKARDHLDDVSKAYASLVGQPGVNPWFALGAIAAVKRRLDGGERTAALYVEIMELE